MNVISTFRYGLGAALMAALAVSASAQGGRGGRGRGPADTSIRFRTTGTLPGWAGALECLQCTIHLSPTGTWVEFGAEPIVRGKSADGGVLMEGDVLVAVDDMLITTPAGARRLANLGGQPTRLTIRRT